MGLVVIMIIIKRIDVLDFIVVKVQVLEFIDVNSIENYLLLLMFNVLKMFC